MPDRPSADRTAELLLWYLPGAVALPRPKDAAAMRRALDSEVILKLALGRRGRFRRPGAERAAQRRRVAGGRRRRTCGTCSSARTPRRTRRWASRPAHRTQAIKESFRLLMQLVHPDRQGARQTLAGSPVRRRPIGPTGCCATRMRAQTFDREAEARAARRARRSTGRRRPRRRRTMPVVVWPAVARGGASPLASAVLPEWLTAGVGGYVRAHPAVDRVRGADRRRGRWSSALSLWEGRDGSAGARSPRGAARPRSAARPATRAAPVRRRRRTCRRPAAPAPDAGRAGAACASAPIMRAPRRPGVGGRGRPSSERHVAPPREASQRQPRDRRARPVARFASRLRCQRAASPRRCRSPASRRPSVAVAPSRRRPPMHRVPSPSVGPEVDRAMPEPAGVSVAIGRAGRRRRAPPSAAPALPPASAEIEALFATFVDTYERGRLDAFAALFDDDADTNLRHGRAAIRGEYDELFRLSQWRRMQLTRINWRRVGDRAYRQGRNHGQDRLARRPRGRAARQRGHGARAPRRARGDRPAVASAEESVSGDGDSAGDAHLRATRSLAIAVVVALVLVWRVVVSGTAALSRDAVGDAPTSRRTAPLDAGCARRAVARAPRPQSDRLPGAGDARAAARAAGQDGGGGRARCARRCGSPRRTSGRCSKRRRSTCAPATNRRRSRSCAAPSSSIRRRRATVWPVFAAALDRRPARRILRRAPRATIPSGGRRSSAMPARRRHDVDAVQRVFAVRAASGHGDRRRAHVRDRSARSARSAGPSAYQVWLNSLPLEQQAARSATCSTATSRRRFPMSASTGSSPQQDGVNVEAQPIEGARGRRALRIEFVRKRWSGDAGAAVPDARSRQVPVRGSRPRRRARHLARRAMGPLLPAPDAGNGGRQLARSDRFRGTSEWVDFHEDFAVPKDCPVQLLRLELANPRRDADDAGRMLPRGSTATSGSTISGCAALTSATGAWYPDSWIRPRWAGLPGVRRLR